MLFSNLGFGEAQLRRVCVNALARGRRDRAEFWSESFLMWRDPQQVQQRWGWSQKREGQRDKAERAREGWWDEQGPAAQGLGGYRKDFRLLAIMRD